MDIKDMLRNAQRSMSSTYDHSVESLLDRMGLEHKRSTMEVVLPALGIFGAGIAVGAALGVLFAPKRGDELRGDLRHRIGDLRDLGVQNYETLRERGSHLLERSREEQVPAQSSVQGQAQGQGAGAGKL